MAHKSMVLAALVVFCGVVFMAGFLTAAEAPDEVTINDPAFGGQNKKGPVKLNHKKHVEDYGVSCTECHHDYQDGKNVWKEGDPVKTCGECHPMEESQGKLYKLKAGTAFHNNCRECHKAQDKGPYKKCNDCHAEK